MRRGSWMIPFALVVAAGCANTDGAADEEAEAPSMAAADQLACQPTASGEELAERQSPYDSVSVTIDGGEAQICYSRPSLRGRTMIGGEAVPWGQLWRFGANEPTIIHLNTAASIAGATVEPGSYSLYTVPQEGEEWMLVVNRSTSQWGHEGQYTPEVESQEMGRYPIRAETLDEPVEQFTIREAPERPGIVAEWQNSRVHIPIEPVG